jgi:hypothetical protein
MVYVSSPPEVSKPTRHRPKGPDASEKAAQALAAISAESSSESGSSVGIADIIKEYVCIKNYNKATNK